MPRPPCNDSLLANILRQKKLGKFLVPASKMEELGYYRALKILPTRLLGDVSSLLLRMLATRP